MNNFLKFLKKPVFCKCGHPNKPSHRSNKWYDRSTECSECSCREFVSRKGNTKLNKAGDISILIGLGIIGTLGCMVVTIFFISGQFSDPKVTISISIKEYSKIAFMLGSLFLYFFGIFIYETICTTFRMWRKPMMPIDEKWNDKD